MVTATMSTFVSLTAHCARCHDHKFDPIRQEDYYSLQAVFAGVDRAERPYDLDPDTYRQRRGLLKQKREIQAGIQPVSDALAQLSSPEIEALDKRMDLLQDRRDQLNHAKTAGKTTEERAKNEVLDEQLRAADEKLDKAKERRWKMTHALLAEADWRKLATLREQLVRVQETLAEFPKPRVVYAAANHFETNGNFRPAWTPRPVHLLDRGSVEAPVKLMGPGAVSAVAGLSSRFKIDDPNDEGARRAALSKWIVDARNPLTWRSIVNRIWHYHLTPKRNSTLTAIQALALLPAGIRAIHHRFGRGRHSQGATETESRSPGGTGRRLAARSANPFLRDGRQAPAQRPRSHGRLGRVRKHSETVRSG